MVTCRGGTPLEVQQHYSSPWRTFSARYKYCSDLAKDCNPGGPDQDLGSVSDGKKGQPNHGVTVNVANRPSIHLYYDLLRYAEGGLPKRLEKTFAEAAFPIAV